jgi:hypothetical protein
MRRRDLIAGLGTAAVGWPLVARGRYRGSKVESSNFFLLAMVRMARREVTRVPATTTPVSVKEFRRRG